MTDDVKTMFDNFPQPEGYIPDNRFKHMPAFKLDIMAGETAEHSFAMPFHFMQDCIDVHVLYKLGIEVILDIQVTQEDINDEDNIVTVKLTPNQTALFSHNYLNALVQLKFTMVDNSIVYSEIYKINVIDALDVERPSDSEV